MKCRLIATGERVPAWVAQGFTEYHKRLSCWLPLELVEIEPSLRGKNHDPQQAMKDEGRKILAALPKQPYTVTLEVNGKPFNSEELAKRLEYWRGSGRNIVFLIGGPEGHCQEVLNISNERWSLGPLTLPHMLVRLIVVEQLYRAATILSNHPYHRGK
ncbi:MAG TPA: 23S rRNA (pseudouridine(1915)-N(3))-methyltransferase RlmH [Xylella sp.]